MVCLSMNDVLCGKYLVYHLDLKIYKSTTATTKNNNLIQLFSPRGTHLTTLFLALTALLMSDGRQTRRIFLRTV